MNSLFLKPSMVKVLLQKEKLTRNTDSREKCCTVHHTLPQNQILRSDDLTSWFPGPILEVTSEFLFRTERQGSESVVERLHFCKFWSSKKWWRLIKDRTNLKTNLKRDLRSQNKNKILQKTVRGRKNQEVTGQSNSSIMYLWSRMSETC